MVDRGIPVDPVMMAYYQAIGRASGVSDIWEDGGITWGLRLERIRKKRWALSIGALRDARGHTVPQEYDHRPTSAETIMAFADGRLTLLDFLDGRDGPHRAGDGGTAA